jgi:hypothetical protein
MASTGAGARVETRDLEADEFSQWIALVGESQDGSAYAHPAHLGALCRAAGAGFRILGAFLDGGLVAGVPLFERQSRWGTYVENRLLLYYNGLLLRLPPKKFPSDATAQEVAVLDALAADIDRRRYAYVQLHNRSSVTDVRPFLARGWQASVSYTYVVPLDDIAGQWARVDPNLRRLIARCEREGVTYREDDDFGALYRLHEETHRRKGAPLYLPERDFTKYFEEVRSAGLARVAHAVLGGRIIASQLMLTGTHPVAHTVCAGADEQHLRLGASAFLRWQSCVALARDGYTANDLTDAGLNSVTHFKSQLGGVLTPTLTLWRARSRGYRLESAVRRWFYSRAARGAPASGGSA